MVKYLQSISKSKDGFSFGDLWQYSDESLVAIIPILRITDLERDYMLLQEAEKLKISDTGMINQVSIENYEDVPLYVRMGTLFTGKTQNRTAVRSYVVMPGTTTSIEVKCVHASHCINTDADMKAAGVVSTAVESRINTSMSEKRVVTQSEVWSTVKEVTDGYSSSLSSMSNGSMSKVASDDLKASMEAFAELLKDVLPKVPQFDNQVGLTVLDTEQVIGIELFDLCQSWQAIRNDIIKKEGENIAKQEENSMFGFQQDAVIDKIKEVLQEDFDETVVHESSDYKVVGLSSEKYVGELTEYKDKVIHTSIIYKKSGQDKARQQASSSSSNSSKTSPSS